MTRTNSDERSLLEELLSELQKHVDADEDNVFYRATKGQAIIKSMVNEALKGDQKMLANVLKFIEKLDVLQTGQRAGKEEHTRWSKTDWEMLFHFVWRYRKHLAVELVRMQRENPGAFKGEWENAMLEQAPWYEVVHGEAAR